MADVSGAVRGRRAGRRRVPPGQPGLAAGLPGPPPRDPGRGQRGDPAPARAGRPHGARFLLASTSEVYGDPAVHPQVESYRGNVDPVGPAQRLRRGQAVRRGPDHGHPPGPRGRRGHRPHLQHLRPPAGPRATAGWCPTSWSRPWPAEPLTVYGDGSQTRSLCYVDDEVAGLLALLDSTETGPVNIGNPDERTVLELAQLVLEVTGSRRPRSPSGPCPPTTPPGGAPTSRCARASARLGAERSPLGEGLARTVEYFAAQGRAASAADRATAGGDGG